MEVRFRPAALRAHRTYRLDGGRLSQFDHQGQLLWSLDLATVDRAAYVSFGTSRAPMRRLDLFAGQTLHRIGLNAGAGLGTMSDEMRDFLALSEAICRALAEHRTDAEVTIGEYGRARWALFGVAATMVLGGAGLYLAALVSGVSPARLTEVTIPTGLLVVLGLTMGWATWPGRPNAALPAAAMADVLQSMQRPG